MFLDARRRGPLRRAEPRRARRPSRAWSCRSGSALDRLHAITGHAPPYIFPVARYLWFRKHHDASRVARAPHAERLDHLPALGRAGRRALERGRVDALRRHAAGVVARDPGRARRPAGILPPLCEAGHARRQRDGGGRGGDRHSRAARPSSPAAPTRESALLGSGVYAAGRDGRRPRHDHAGADGDRPPDRSTPSGAPLDELPRRAGPLGAREQRGRHRRRVPLAPRARLRRHATPPRTRAAEKAMAAAPAGGAAGLLSPRPRHLQPARHEPVQARRASSSAFPLLHVDRPPRGEHPARLPREHRVRDPRQLRADQRPWAASRSRGSP